MIKNKLKSRRGASITFGLLIFLLCAVVSAAAIVAGSATGGRMSQIAESDQRYYAVNSAVEYLKKTMDGQEVRIITETTQDSTVTYDGSGIPQGSGAALSDKEVTCSVQLNGTDVGRTETPITVEKNATSFEKKVKVDYLTPLLYAACQDDPFIKLNDGTADQAITYPVTFTVSGLPEGADASALMDVDATSFKNPLNLYVYRTYTDKGTAHTYSLKLTFVADKQSVTNTRSSSGTPQTLSGGGYTVKTTTVTTETVTYRWELTSINKQVKPTALGEETP